MSFVTESFIRTLRNIIYKYMISILKNCVLIDLVRMSKYKNSFAKGDIPNWSEVVLVNKKSKNLFRGRM